MPRILIVDDEENQRRSLALGLTADGFVCEEAAGGEAALAVLERDPGFDLVLVDLMMPQLSGIEVARRVRWCAPDAVVVLASAYHLSARQLVRSGCGAAAFVPKPYHLPELCAFLRQKLRPATVGA